jgi:hypothetical protein
MMRNQQGSAAVQVIWAVTAIVVVIAAFMIVKNTSPGAPEVFTTPYQAVLLMNGSAYFGKLEGYGTPHPVLKEVYYIVTQTNPETKTAACWSSAARNCTSPTACISLPARFYGLSRWARIPR